MLVLHPHGPGSELPFLFVPGLFEMPRPKASDLPGGDDCALELDFRTLFGLDDGRVAFMSHFCCCACWRAVPLRFLSL